MAIRTPRRSAGFTLIELVTVLLIVGALAVFVAPRIDIGGFERYAFRQEVLAGLRYAQKTAMASSCDVAVRLDAGADAFSLFYRAGGTATSCGGGGFTDPVADPGADPSRGSGDICSPRSSSAPPPPPVHPLPRPKLRMVESPRLPQ